MANYASIMPGVEVTLLPAATTAIGAGTAVAQPAQMPYLRFVITALGTISTGKLVLEESNDPAFSGTWSAIVSEITITAGITAVHTVGFYGFVRARVSTTVTGAGGSITVAVTGGQR